jgi:NADPH:quinone reductase-like Zn-dependent oxidoreductase
VGTVHAYLRWFRQAMCSPLNAGTYGSAKLSLPFVPGGEGVAKVVAAGSDVTDLKVGDRVLSSGASPVPVQMWQAAAQSRCRCGRRQPSPGADVAGGSPVPAQMW